MRRTFPDSDFRSTRENRDGFTLVELLVVIAMLALIATIQVSAMSAAKGRTRAVVCSDNVRQLTMSLHIYGGENEDKLPKLAGWATWAWDVPGNVCQTLLSFGLEKRTFYCPSTAPMFTDNENFLNPYPNALWNFGSPPTAYEGDPNYFHITGYVLALSGTASKLNVRYQNATVTSETHLTGAAAFHDSPSTRVLATDVIISTGNFYPARETEPFQGISGGFYKRHLSAHLVEGGIPSGANVGFKDGHVQWKKFNSPPAGFSVPSGSRWLNAEETYTMVRTSTAPYFWW